MVFPILGRLENIQEVAFVILRDSKERFSCWLALLCVMLKRQGDKRNLSLSWQGMSRLTLTTSDYLTLAYLLEVELCRGQVYGEHRSFRGRVKAVDVMNQKLQNVSNFRKFVELFSALIAIKIFSMPFLAAWANRPVINDKLFLHKLIGRYLKCKLT